MRENNEREFENNLIVPSKEKLLTRFFKWVANLFGKHKKSTLEIPKPDRIVPKAVKMTEAVEEFEENSLEYLYQLSDEELDELDDNYSVQMEENQKEIERLNGILQAYKDTIKKLQGQFVEE